MKKLIATVYKYLLLYHHRREHSIVLFSMGTFSLKKGFFTCYILSIPIIAP